MDKVPGTHKSQQPEPEIPGDAPSDHPDDIANNLPDEMVAEALAVEEQTWAQNGMSTMGIGIDIFSLNVQFLALLEIFYEENIINKEQFDVMVDRRKLSLMIQIRKQFQQQALMAKLMEGVVPQVPKDIFMPPGFRKDG